MNNLNSYIQQPWAAQTRTYSSAYKQRGLGLVSAIFVITILAMIAAGMATIVANSGKIHSQKILSIRAQSAAQSGLEIKMASMTKNNSCASDETQYAFDTQGLYDCFAQVSCSSVSAQGKHFISLKSIGSCGSDLDKAVRIAEKRFLK